MVTVMKWVRKGYYLVTRKRTVRGRLHSIRWFTISFHFNSSARTQGQPNIIYLLKLVLSKITSQRLLQGLVIVLSPLFTVNFFLKIRHLFQDR